MNYIILVSLIIMAICFLIRVPIGYSMFIACILFFILSGKDIGQVAAVSMGKLYTNGLLIAIPLFIFTASIMNSSKTTERMFTFTKALIGQKRGATAYINIILSLIFSGMSGSAMADVCGMGMMEIKQMDDDGYDRPFSCAITCATATVGPIFPPSIPLVIYGLIAQVSVGKLFMGGMIPAFLICFVLGVYVWYVSKKRNYPTGIKFTFKEFLKYTFKAFPALLTPVILLGGIYSGLVTATEAGAVAALYAIIISIFVYRSLTIKSLLVAIKETVLQSSVVMFIAFSAFVLAFIVQTSGIGDDIVNWFLSLTTNKYVFLLIVNIVFLFLGMVLDTSIITWVFLPLVLPIVSALGIDLIHFGIVYVVNLMLGFCTPPYGVMCFSISAITKVPLQKIFKEIIPMCILMLIVLLLITYVPAVVTTIPNLLLR